MMMFLNLWIKINLDFFKGHEVKDCMVIQLSYHNEDKKTHLSSMELLFNIVNCFSIMY